MTTDNTQGKGGSKQNAAILICSGILGLLIVTIIILSFVGNAFLSKVDDFLYVQIYEASQSTTAKEVHKDGVDDIAKDEYKDFKNALGKTKFSVMHGILEGKWATSPKFVKDDDGERVEAKADEVNNYVAGSLEYMLVLNWGQGNTQSMVVENTTIEYDLIKFAISNSGGEVIRVKVYAYKYIDFATNDEELEDRYVSPFYIYLDSTDLYSTVKDIVDNN